MRFAALVTMVLLGAVSVGSSWRASAPPVRAPGTTTLTNATVPRRTKPILPEVNFEDEGTDGPNDLGGSLPIAADALRDAK
jgi:hypothetical protein